mgnify:CR=1 FL=1
MEKKEKVQNLVPDWILEAREKWNYYGQVRPPFAEKPKPGQRSVWDFPRPPALKISSKRVTVKWQETQLASSTNALELLETASPPTYYIPREDVNSKWLIKIPKKQSLCEWKGRAEYWALIDTPSEPVAWTYERPFPEYGRLQGYFAFYPQHLACYLNEEKATPQPGLFYAGWITSDLAGPFKGESGSGHW